MSRRVYAARAGRTVGGFIGAVLALVFAVFIVFLNSDRWLNCGRLFLSAWPIAVAIGTGTFLTVWALPRRADQNPFELAGRAYALEVKSIAWPLTALALLVPLTVQYLVLDVYDVEYRFAYWMKFWMLTTGPSHALLVYFSKKLARGVPSFSRFAVKAWCAITASGLLGAFLFALMTTRRMPGLEILIVFVLLTGSFALGFLPAWYSARAIIDGERNDIAKSTASFDAPPRLRKMILDEDIGENARIMALYALARSGVHGLLMPAIEDALFSPSAAVSAAALDLAHHLRHRPAVAGMTRMLAHEERRTVLVACEIAKAMRDPALERVLIAVLARATPMNDSALAVAAIGAIAACGTPSSIEVLWQVKGMRWLNGEVKETAEEAIERIQCRAQLDGDGGELSIATRSGNEGAISLPQSERGALSDPNA